MDALVDESSRDSVVLDHEDLQYLTNVQLSNEFTTTDPSVILNGNMAYDNDIQSPARVSIVEQPQQRGFRFRYECEGPSHGGLQGEKTERGRKTYPSIRVENYQGSARIEVSLVTDESPPKIHAHKLVGKNCKDGICKVDVSSTASQISFPNLCVLHVTRKKAAEVLANRLLEDLKIQKQMESGHVSEPNISAGEHMEIKKQAEEQSRNMQLNVVRLKFRVFLPNPHGEYLILLPPVVSQPIYDSKSPGASALKICRMDKYGGCCTGNEEVFLLCEKVQKEDIAVRFVESNPDGSVKWEAYGNFSPLDVHRQYAIVFKTPAYYNANIDKAVNVLIMLQRKSDAEVSEAKAFTYYPQNRDKDNIARKKRKTLPLDSTFNYYGGDGGGPPGPGGGMGGGFGPAPGGPGGGGGMMSRGGGGVLPNNFSVIMPNGSVVDQLNVLPTTVEQVVKEEFARSSVSTSPETTSTEDSYNSPLASPFDPMLWGTSMNFLNDLEIDAAHSLPHPAQRSFVTHHAPDIKQEPLDVIPERPPEEVLKKPSEKALQKGAGRGITGAGRKRGVDRNLVDGRFPVQEVEKAGMDVVDGMKPQQESVPAEEDVVDGLLASRLESAVKLQSEGDTVDDLQASAEPVAEVASRTEVKPEISSASASAECDRGSDSKDAQHKVSGASARGRGDGDQVIVDRSEDSSSHAGVVADPHLRRPRPDRSETDSGRELSDSTLSPTRMSVEMSEGVRTDEGFSEVSVEETSVPSQAGKQEKSASPKAKSKKEDPKEKPNKPVKVATTVVKRVMERMTARTIRALQDYSETGDPRYLLIVQRHLTAIKNENGDLPIHLAVINNQTTSLRNLLDIMMSLPNSRRTVNTYNYTRQTALHLAAIMQQSLHIEMLLHAGGDPSLADRNGNTPAHLAVLNNSLEALRSLIKYLRPGVTASDPFPELNYLNYDGYAPVHLAVQNSSVDMLRLLVHGKANVDMPDGKSGRTPLHHAVELDDLPVAGYLLLEAEAEVNARCFDGNTPLHIACCRGLIGMVALLTTAGALTDIENEEIPSEEEQEEEVAEDVGENQRRDRRGLQPIDYAAGKDRMKILNILFGEPFQSDEEDAPRPPSDIDLEEDTDRLLMHKSVGEMHKSVGEIHKSVCDSGVSISLASLSSPPSLPTEEADKLSVDMQQELCKLLDPMHAGKDVYALAEKLGYNQIIDGLEAVELTGTSPTQFLLNYHENYHGTVDKLKECLQAIKRDDAVQLIEEGERGLLRRKQQCETSLGDSGVQMSMRT